MKVIYIYDTLCGWCNVARPKVVALKTKIDEHNEKHLDNKISFDAIHFNLFEKHHMPKLEGKFLDMVKEVAFEVSPKMDGGKFSQEYIDLLVSGDFIHNSDKSSLACTIMREKLHFDDYFSYAMELQALLFEQGVAIDDSTVLDDLSEKYALDKGVFNDLLFSKEIMDIKNFNKSVSSNYMNQLRANGVPILVTEQGEDVDSLNPHNLEEVLSALGIKN
jgi:putative protein-disulfide isomerase